MAKLNGKVAVVTGGSSGIGLATAKRFVEEGAYVFIVGRRQDALEAAVKQIGKNVKGVRADVSNLDDLDRLYKEVASTKGKLDVVVANAAFVEIKSTPAVTPEHFDKTFNTNARGVWFTIAKALPVLNDGGSVILVGSGGWAERLSRLWNLRRHQGGAAFLRAHLDDRTEGQEDSRESHQPWRG